MNGSSRAVGVVSSSGRSSCSSAPPQTDTTDQEVEVLCEVSCVLTDAKDQQVAIVVRKKTHSLFSSFAERNPAAKLKKPFLKLS